MAHDDLVCPPSVSARDHPARRLALSPFHAQLSRRRRSACGARSVRPPVCPRPRQPGLKCPPPGGNSPPLTQSRGATLAAGLLLGAGKGTVFGLNPEGCFK